MTVTHPALLRERKLQMNMDKIYIEFDETKLKNYGISIDSAREYLDKLYAKMNMERDNEGWYTNGCFESIGAINRVLKDNKWFIDSINKWWWYQDDTGAIEDIGSFYKTGVARYVN